MLSLLRSSGLALSRKGLAFRHAARASAWHPFFLLNSRNASLIAGNVLKSPDAPPRESMEYDVVVVGAGPSGLAAAIRIKQLAQEQSKEVSVCVVEKGAEVGSHILSGNCFNPKALNELFPNWKELGAPLETEIKKDQMFFLTEKRAFPVPLPKMMHNDGNYIISLQALVKWLGKQAEQLGVEIYPGFSAAEVLLDDQNQVAGIATSDVGVGKTGEAGDAYARGMELKSKQLLLAEGCRGSLSEIIMKHFNLRKDADPQTYGIGIKEIWEVPAEKCQPGLVQHTIGYPLPTDTYGGTFMYHMAPNKILIGQVVGLDYPNPYLNPYEEFQRFKQHPHIRKFLEGGRCVQYGARALNEGGLQSLPKLTFPGGALVGCSAGFLNVPQVKGTHYAMKSGMVAGESLFKALTTENGPKEVTAYEDALKQTWVYKELHEVRNIHPSFKMGFLPFLVYSGLEMFFLKGRVPWTLHNDKHDWQKTKPARECKKIDYPKPDGVISFDLLTNLQRSGTNHNEDQPAHLRVKEALKHVPEKVSLQEFAAPETRFCPAKVYEYVGQEEGRPKLVINAQNCVHCKTCDIKTPQNYIQWTVPEGGGGPSYENM